MDIADAAAQWDQHGFVAVPGMLPPEEIAAGRSELGLLFPAPDEFHSEKDAARNARYRGDEYGGLINFPFLSVELSLLTVHSRLVELAKCFLRTDEVRIYAAEAWGKYTGAFDYEQEHHRDYLNHTLVVPSNDPSFRNLEMFIYLCDVTEGLGPTHLVSSSLTADLPLLPHCCSRADRPDLYQAEISAAGPAGTVLAYRGDTLHRATNLTAPLGARYTLHCSFRPQSNEWVGRHAWGDRSFDVGWSPFVARASLAQLTLFGFPPPGHPYWTPETLAGIAVRYPDLDLSPWDAGV